MDGVYRAGVDARAAIDTGIRINRPLVSRLADGVNRARFITCTAVDAFFGNSMSQGVHLLQFELLSNCLICHTLSYASEIVQHKGFSP